MFSTFKQRLLLGTYIFIIISIPIGAFLASQSKILKSSASEGNSTIVKSTPKPKLSPSKDLLKDSEANVLSKASQNLESTPTPDTGTVATSFGPTLSLKTTLEGRPTNNQSTKLFVGIVEGVLSTNPKFLLSFTVDLPASGIYNNLSLAGLNPGTKYTALLKGSAQIATSSAFVMSPTVTNLNDGQVINMLTGDLNEDNVINSADFSIIQKANGSTPTLTNWNENADLNKDGVINSFDLSIVRRNLGQVGTSGAWTSPVPKVATKSASLTQSPVGSPDQTQGYWLWLPK